MKSAKIAVVPPTTALRWIAQMTEAGLLERIEDETDRRRAFIALSDRAAEAIAVVVGAAHESACGTPAGTWTHEPAGMGREAKPIVWPYFPLDPANEGAARWTDLTFRLGLIGRLLGRTIEVV